MASDYPGAVDSFRSKANVPGQSFDASKTTRLYIEDIETLEDDIIAVEETLGVNPQGSYDTVVERLDDMGGGGGTWGSITGTLSDQTDLQSALDAKEDALGFTPEDVANKENSTIDTSTTKYPTVNLLNTGLLSRYRAFALSPNPVLTVVGLPTNGKNDIYTCPSGKRALILSMQTKNTSGGNRVVQPFIKISSVYYALAAAQNPANNANSIFISAVPIALEAGEIMAFSNGGAGGVEAFLVVLEMLDTSPLKSVKNTSPSGGATIDTLYTCPSSHYAELLNNNMLIGAYQSFMMFSNSSGGNITFSGYVVPSGQTASATYLLGSQLGSNNNLVASQVCGMLNVGDFLAFNCSANTASQLIWITVAEYPL